MHKNENKSVFLIFAYVATQFWPEVYTRWVSLCKFFSIILDLHFQQMLILDLNCLY